MANDEDFFSFCAFFPCSDKNAQRDSLLRVISISIQFSKPIFLKFTGIKHLLQFFTPSLIERARSWFIDYFLSRSLKRGGIVFFLLLRWVFLSLWESLLARKLERNPRKGKIVKSNFFISKNREKASKRSFAPWKRNKSILFSYRISPQTKFIEKQLFNYCLSIKSIDIWIYL